MNEFDQMIKEAYAYGASIALQEAGYPQEQAKVASEQLTQEKLAEEDEGLSGLEGALLGGGAGALLGAGGGALAGRITQSNLLTRLLAKLLPVRQPSAFQERLRAMGKGVGKIEMPALLSQKGPIGQLGGSALLGAGTGAGAGALGGGLYSGLTD